VDDRVDFSLVVSQNKFLSADDTRMDAVLTVTARGTGPMPEHAEVLLVDCSSSMDWPPTKIAAARRATKTAIDTLRDGVLFGMVQGTSQANMIYPSEPRLVPANQETRAEAKAAADRLIAGGGTAIGTWLILARQLLTAHPTAVRHAVLLTDGKNESESRQHLDHALDACEDDFVCDARGIGDEWAPDELARIVTVLRGSADAVLEDAELAEDFRQMIEAAMSKVVPELRLRVTTVEHSSLRFVKQVFPTEADLTDRAVQAGQTGRTVELSTGAWGEESREYHLCLDLDPMQREKDEEVQLGWAELEAVTAGARTPGEPVPILGYWTEDPMLSVRIDPKVEQYTMQAGLSDAVAEGCAAFDRGDPVRAQQEWGRAVALASTLGNEELLKRLRRLVEIDPNTGVVRIKDNLRPRDVFSAVMGSKISWLGPGAPTENPAPEQTPDGPAQTCPAPDCGWSALPTAIVCERCGEPLRDGGMRIEEGVP